MTNSEPIKDVLLIEDDSSYQDLVLIAFEENKIKHNLHIAKDGKQALAFLQQQHQYIQAPRPDLILLDLDLPGMHGHEILQIIKQDRQFKLIPVVVFTTSTEPKDIMQSYSLKANCYISKPYELEDFLAAINKSLDFWLKFVKFPQRSSIN